MKNITTIILVLVVNHCISTIVLAESVPLRKCAGVSSKWVPSKGRGSTDFVCYSTGKQLDVKVKNLCTNASLTVKIYFNGNSRKRAHKSTLYDIKPGKKQGTYSCYAESFSYQVKRY